MLGAGCPRVTHPFAARAPFPKERASLDLHVLSTPPAFVLSQDQTLRECLWIFRQAGLSTQKVTVLRRFQSLVHTSWVYHLCTKQRMFLARCTKGIRIGHACASPMTGFFGTDFWHAVEFSRNGRAPVEAARPLAGQPLAGQPFYAMSARSPLSKRLPRGLPTCTRH